MTEQELRRALNESPPRQAEAHAMFVRIFDWVATEALKRRRVEAAKRLEGVGDDD